MVFLAMTQGAIQISKSQYIRGKQCPLSLWNALHRRDLAADADASRAAILATGQDMGGWAKKSFPGGIEIKAPFFDQVAGAAETKILIDGGNEIIFEATAVHPAGEWEVLRQSGQRSMGSAYVHPIFLGRFVM